MSYKVLARKWRPQHFRDMIGQEPVLRALVNALDSNRLHHAYLFTGMRGVGKTTIARIFAKCLNCETNGVSASPCGECSACKDIEAGRFFDLIEVDAASRTKVEETRELLENVPYAPASGRYKVYLIDEVHMFSNHSFNALLKTLEEPPEHVKFLLATTDPQKVPVTVLSRCLQFNLKRMAPNLLADYLSRILQEESIEHDRPALDLIARASEGSVRDSLSLVEQAAAFGEGAVREADVESMLGRASTDRLLGLIESLARADIAELFERVEQLAEYAPDFTELMGEILSLLHRIAMLQSVPGSVSDSTPGFDRLTNLSGAMAADEVQLYYQIGVHARRDMPFSPDPREAFDMALLRMHAFRPQGDVAGNATDGAGPEGNQAGFGSRAITGSSGHVVRAAGNKPESSEAVNVKSRASESRSVETAQRSQPSGSTQPPCSEAATVAGPDRATSLPVIGEVSAGGSLRAAALAAARGEAVPESAMAPIPGLTPAPQAPQPAQQAVNAAQRMTDKATESSPARASRAIGATQSSGTAVAATGGKSADDLANETAEKLASDSVHEAAVNSASESANAAANKPADKPSAEPVNKADIKPENWHQIVSELDISGMPRQLASNTELLAISGSHVQLKLATGSEHLNKPPFVDRLQSALSNWLGQPVELAFELVDAELSTPAMLDEQRRLAELAAARVSIESDPVVLQLIDRLDAAVDDASVLPLGQNHQS